MSLLDRVVVSGPPSPSMKFEELGKQLCTSGWFSLALAGLGPPLDDAMLCGCSWGRFSICVMVV